MRFAWLAMLAEIVSSEDALPSAGATARMDDPHLVTILTVPAYASAERASPTTPPPIPVAIRQDRYFTPHPYAFVRGTRTGRPADKSSSAAST